MNASNGFILTPPEKTSKPNFSKPNGGTPPLDTLPDEALPEALEELALQGAPLPRDEIIGRANLENARRYTRAGRYVVRVPLREKAPRKNDWQKDRFTEEDLPHHFATPSNVGVILGEPSGGLVDVDLDDPRAVAIARFFWPQDTLTFGRRSKPRSHLLVAAIDEVPTRHAFKHAIDGRMLLEIRGTGHQTIFPHSLHPSGELIHWYHEGKVPRLDEAPRLPGREIARRARLHATAAQLVEFYPGPNSHARHDFALPLAGFLLNLGLSYAEAKRIFEALASAAQDEELADRLRVLEDTYKRHEAGQPTTGGPTLEQSVDRRVLDKIRSWWWQVEARFEVRTAPPREELPEMNAEEEKSALQALEKLEGEDTWEDLPAGALEGRLGELYERYLPYLPRAYAWPILLTFAGALVPFDEEHDPIRPNLYAALVGPPASGKSTCIKHVARLLSFDNVRHLRLKAGSFEGLALDLEAEGEARVLDVDELGHLLRKAAIENSSFPKALDTLYYESRDAVRVRGGKKIECNVRLSLVGGLTEEEFPTAFANTGLDGLYSRFVFGLSRQPFEHPLESPPPQTITAQRVHVKIRELREFLRALRTEGIHPRDLEIMLRVAFICASIDGQSELGPEHLGPHVVFARYLRDVRQKLVPLVGRTLEGQCEERIVRALENRKQKTGNDWMPLRELKRAIHVSRDFSSPIFGRVIEELHRRGEIERYKMKTGKERGREVEFVRLAPSISEVMAQKRADLEAKYQAAPRPGPSQPPNSEQPQDAPPEDDPEAWRRVLEALDEP